MPDIACWWSRIALLVLLVGVPVWAEEGRFSFTVEEDALAVHLDGQLFTRYYTQGSQVPYLWPIIGPGGIEMTRAFPMREGATDEAVDHLHHRSVWFAHGDVNGIDFWHDANKSGRIEHKQFLRIGTPEDPTIVAHSEWVDDDGERQCSDIRMIRFGADDKSRWIDFDISIIANPESPVTFGDTKEGCLGIRVPATMKVDAQQGGEIVTSNDDRNDAAWGTRGAWVDYHGPVDGRLVGIAALNHPDSFRFPTYWHVRSYGLFAANVFGLRVFRNAPNEDGSVTLAPGESMTFCYRILLHEGDQEAAQIREKFIDYAKVDKSVTPASLMGQLDTTPAAEAEIEIQPQAKTAGLPTTTDGAPGS